MLWTIAGLMMPGAAAAQSNVTYNYDALGRLVVSTNQTAGTNVRTTVDYDRAGNRKTLTVTGAVDGNGDPSSGANEPATRGFVVIPLNGFTLIPLK